MLPDGIKKTVLVLVLLASLLSAGVALSFAQQASPQQDARRQQAMDRFGVTPEQMEQFRSIRQDAKAEAEALQRQIRQKRQALMQYVQSPNAEEGRAMAMHRELNDLTARVGELRIRTVFRMKEIMTPEQFEQFASQRQQARSRIMDRMQQRQGSGGFQGGPRQRFQQRGGGQEGAPDGPRRRWQPPGN